MKVRDGRTAAVSAAVVHASRVHGGCGRDARTSAGETPAVRRLTLIVALLIMACSSPAPAPPPPTTETVSAQPAPVNSGPRVIFPDNFVVNVEIAADDEMRAQGLMYRDHIDPGKGMLFVFPRDGVTSFWMKNTRIPLDMIWIDVNERIVGMRENVPPCHVQDCPSYGPGVIARYVLEVGAGEAAKHQLKTGDTLQFVDIDVEAR